MPPDWNASQARKSISARKLCLPPYRPAYGGQRNSNTGPSGYRPLRYSCPCLTQLEAIAIHIMLGRGPLKSLRCTQTSLRPLIRSDLSNCLPERRAFRPDGGGLEHQANELEFEANNDKGQAPAWLCQRTFLFDLWAGYTYHYPM